jgi:RNA-directed DNA polymerase
MGRSRSKSRKSFEIPKRLIFRAWEQVRANNGAPGVDGVSVVEFETDLQDNLYKVWNRMSSGSYCPAPVRAVEIPKADGGVWVLGVPTVADRVAQTAVCMWLEERFEPIFHPDSYGYRPGRSALDAVAVCRRRCWERDWVIDLDIRAFFDSVDHELLMKALAHHTDERWVLLYVQRWLVAPMQTTDVTLVERDRGTPQGSPVSPLLANLFMHYAFDMWLSRNHPDCQFERYADDAVIHCDSEGQARQVLAELGERLGSLGLELHSGKTKVVYCKDRKRSGTFSQTSFDFLGYTFRARSTLGPRGPFWGFNPAMATKARKTVSAKIRGWHLNRCSETDLAHLASRINPRVRGWVAYYGAFHRSATYFIARLIDEHLVRWAMRKFKRFRRKPTKAREWLAAIERSQPDLFTHWQLTASSGRTVGAV